MRLNLAVFTDVSNACGRYAGQPDAQKAY
jgi:hypothetical protein